MGALTRRTWLILFATAMVALGLLLAALFVERQGAATQRVRQEAEVRERLALLQSRLEGNLKGNLMLVRGLVSIVAAHPNLDQATFERYVRPLFDGPTQLRNVALAPDLVIRVIYPMAGNEKALGIDLRKTPDQFAAVERSRLSRNLVLAGPLELVQGGQALIARIPVFISGDRGGERFWGMISAVIDINRLYRDSGLVADLPIEVALRGRDGTDVSGEVFYGDPALFEADHLAMAVEFPSGSWQMAARPRGGWSSRLDNAGALRGGFVLVALLILGPMLLLARLDHRQQRAERQLAASKERLTLALEGAQLMVWDWEPVSGKVAGNRAMQAMFEFSGGEGAPNFDAFKALIHPEDIAQFEAAVAAHLQGRSPQLEIDFRLRGSGDDWRWLHGMGKVVRRTEDGQPLRLSGVLQDISVLKRALIELEAARAAAEAGSRAKSEFLATMSHEIRTPMNGVLGMADLLLTTPLDAEQKSFVAILKTSGRSLMTIINDILDYSKIEAGRLTLETIDFAPAALAQEVCDLLRPLAAGKGLQLELDSPADLPVCLQGDAYRIRQVLVNLLGNAIKFTQVGRIDVELAWRQAEPGKVLLRLAVRDTGIGIAAQAQERLFMPFTQGDASITRRYGGTGLGLTISRRLIEAMRGRIGVISAPGDGACFWCEISLPVCSSAQIDSALQRETLKALAAAEPAMQFRGRVLLVEDNPVNLQVARQMLLRQGVEVVTAENGRSGVERFAAGHFDLVLMDMQMPEMDGLEATQAMRALQAGKPDGRTPIVALTANIKAEDSARCKAAGMDDFIAKPLRLRDVVAVLRRWLGEGAEKKEKKGPGSIFEDKSNQAPFSQDKSNQAPFSPVFEVQILDELGAATGMARADLIAMLFTDIERMAAELASASAQQDCDAMHRLAHTIKSLCAQLGAQQLAVLARNIEDAAHDRQAAGGAEWLPAFAAGLDELRAALQALPDNPSAMA